MCKTSDIDLLQERLGFPRFLVFPCTFSKQPIPFYRVACWDFNWDCIGIFVQLGEIWHLNSIECSDERGISVHLCLFYFLSAKFCRAQCKVVTHISVNASLGSKWFGMPVVSCIVLKFYSACVC